MAATSVPRTLAAVGALILVGALWLGLTRGTLPFVARSASETISVPVLIYHVFKPAGQPQSGISPTVAASQDSPDYEISTDLFDAQLRILHVRGWEAITARDLATLLANGERPKRHTFVITVDDGLEDGLSQALPILQRHHLTATYFVVAGLMGTPGYLSWGQVRTLRDAGIEIGNHTLDHQRLAEIPPAAALAEVADAQRMIEQQLGQAPVTFSYPGGSYNDAAVQAVRDAGGLLAAFTTERGRTFSTATRLTIPRLNVSGTWSPQLLLRYMGPGY